MWKVLGVVKNKLDSFRTPIVIQISLGEHNQLSFEIGLLDNGRIKKFKYINEDMFMNLSVLMRQMSVLVSHATFGIINLSKITPKEFEKLASQYGLDVVGCMTVKQQKENKNWLKMGDVVDLKGLKGLKNGKQSKRR